MSAQRVVSTTDSPNIVIEKVGGNLSVRGWGRQEVAITADPAGIDVQTSDEVLRINVRDDASIQVPVNSRLLIQHVAENLSLSYVSGAVTLQEIEGDLSVRGTGFLTIGAVGDDLSVRLVQGDCVVGRVAGDASLSQITGNLTIERVEDDLDISNVRGSVRAASGDDVSLRLNLLPGCSYDVRAGNDLSCRIPADSSARVSLQAGDALKVHRIEAPPVIGNSATFQLGAGDATLSLVAGDDLNLVGAGSESLPDFSFDFGPDAGARFADFAQQLAAQIEEQVGSIARQLDEKVTNMGGTEELATRIQEKIVAVARRAEEKVTAAVRAAETRAREAEARAREAEARTQDSERRGRGRGGWRGEGWAPQPPVPPKAPRAAAPPVSEAERLAVLRMVGDGSISVEQAQTLLKALNGQTGDD